MLDFETWKNDIVEAIENLNQSVIEIDEKINDVHSQNDIQEIEVLNSEVEEIESLSIDSEEVMTVDYTEYLVRLNDSIDSLQVTLVEGFWFVSIGIILAIALKLFYEQSTKW